jgi:hypothetical protein
MRQWIAVVCILLLCLLGMMVNAQDAGLITEDTTVITQLDAYGQEIKVAQGLLINRGETAFNNISLLAEVYNANDEVIGEGFGFPVKACGEGLLPDFTMQPGMSEFFTVPLDIFEPDTTIDRVEITPQADPIAADETIARPAFQSGITVITGREVVSVEWLDNENLIFSSGCWRDIFTNRSWYDYNVRSGIQSPIKHPRAVEITDALRNTIDLADPQLFNRSFFSFAPGQSRAVYQTELNTLVTSEADGSFPRVLYDRLYNISLQGINFIQGGIFVAYYHGGYGDMVLYLTANANGQQLSQHPAVSLPSIIVPGVSPNGQRIIIAAEINGVTGYYLRATNTEFSELLFEAEPPGNNWPAPLYNITQDSKRYIYIARPVDGEARLQCYNPDSDILRDLTSLPLNLETDERGWMWLSPDGSKIALAANGLRGGLWLIDLNEFEACD